MNVERIQSVHNDQVKLWSSLLSSKGRRKSGLFIAEGMHLVQEALDSAYKVIAVVYDKELELQASLTNKLHTLADTRMIEVNSSIIEKCTDAQSPQGIFAVVEQSRETVTSFMGNDHTFVLVLDGIQDPGNVGTIIRSADASGATGVVLGMQSADLYNMKTIRSTMGSLFHLPILQTDVPELLRQIDRTKLPIYAADLQGERYDQALFNDPFWLIMGNEARGISDEVLPYVTKKVTIPMSGKAESLNVAMAATILMFEAQRQRSL